jgi:hypothetical protein
MHATASGAAEVVGRPQALMQACGFMRCQLAGRRHGKTPCIEYGVAYVFASPLPPRVPRFALGRRRPPTEPGPVLSHGAIGCLNTGRIQRLPGSWKIHPMPLPGSTIQAGSDRPSPYRSARYCPSYSDHEDTRDTCFGIQYRGFGIRCLRLKWCVTAPHARLASGWWLAIAGRESNPLDFSERFLLYIGFPFRRLNLARRKVRHEHCSLSIVRVYAGLNPGCLAHCVAHISAAIHPAKPKNSSAL